MSQLVILVIAAAAIMLALLLAYLPMRILLAQMAKKIAAPIRDFIQRQRDRRTAARETPERRKPAESVPPRVLRQPRREQGRDRRDAPEPASPKS
jgi:hypothetical protein